MTDPPPSNAELIRYTREASTLSDFEHWPFTAKLLADRLEAAETEAQVLRDERVSKRLSEFGLTRLNKVLNGKCAEPGCGEPIPLPWCSRHRGDWIALAREAQP